MFGHKTLTKLPEGMQPPEHWFELEMDSSERRRAYDDDWKAFKKEKGVE